MDLQAMLNLCFYIHFFLTQALVIYPPKTFSLEITRFIPRSLTERKILKIKFSYWLTENYRITLAILILEAWKIALLRFSISFIV